MTKLGDIAPTVRSKNAEPFTTTIDIYFEDRDAYEQAESSGRLNEENVAKLYNIPEDAVYGIYFVEEILAAKVTLYKYGEAGYLSQGDPEVSDIFGAQVYVPLLDLEI